MVWVINLSRRAGTGLHSRHFDRIDISVTFSAAKLQRRRETSLQEGGKILPQWQRAEKDVSSPIRPSLGRTRRLGICQVAGHDAHAGPLGAHPSASHVKNAENVHRLPLAFTDCVA
jgi:hypothetical protein